MMRISAVAVLGLVLAGPLRAEEIFVDAAKESGLDFVHANGMTGEMYFPEMMGQGGALFDYDGDGDLDVYCVQGGRLGPGRPEPLRGRLYRNDSMRFVDVTEASGLGIGGYGMGAATGDIDNDGRVDLYLTGYGANRMYRNNGDGTFSDVTERTGTGDPRWSMSAAFFDLDRDGWLDLYVTNYVDYSVEKNPKCFAPSSRRDYCGPADFPPQSHTLYRNRGDGTFEDVSARSGVARKPGPGLGVIAFDPDGDGWTDLFVANDGAPSFLWMNQRDGTFREDGLLAGVAVNRRGQAEAGMGVDAGDFDADGDEDLFVTHLTGESNGLYVNDGTGLFEDRSAESGAARGSLPFTSFGTGWIDYDNDGWLDLFITSGAVRILEPLAEAGDPYPLSQTDQLYRNLGDRAGRLEEVTSTAGAVFQRPGVGRGAAFGDVDNDGDTDVVVFYSNGPVRLLLNQVGSRRSWIGVQAGPPGTRVEVGKLWRRAHTDGSYVSASDPRVLVGLGESKEVVVRIHAAGKVEELRGVPAGRYLIKEP